ncbi:MAG: polysaccharide deacetylase family protein [Bacteroidales bacterium]|nr:polysaccharide deacetylase family protein [Bacteroidales bacterium]
MLIYTPKITKRIKFIFNLIFKKLLNIDISFTSSEDFFLKSELPKLNYSDKALADEIFIAAAGLLYETGVKEQQLVFSSFKGNSCFYLTQNKSSFFPFDPFAAAFFLVSRYEEYLPYLKDKYDRFDAKESIAYKQHFLHKPIVNIWALEISEIIKQKYPNFNIRLPKYKYQPTIDIDLFYAYKLKGLIRTIGGFLKSLSEKDYKGIIERMRVLTGRIKDPFDTYDFLYNLHNKYKLKPIFFILIGDYGQYDKNISYHNRKFQALIKALGDIAEIGIHPSYSSNENSEKLRTEMRRLSNILNKDIKKNRQHFLKLSIPDTYRNLINLDITDDYTMGYASEIGFRAGICSSFNFYDLYTETETPLCIHPFAIMEGTLKDYIRLSNDDALDYVKPIIAEIKAVNGTFISIWHNESLSNEKRWKGWDNIYEEIIKLALS